MPGERAARVAVRRPATATATATVRSATGDRQPATGNRQPRRPCERGDSDWTGDHVAGDADQGRDEPLDRDVHVGGDRRWATAATAAASDRARGPDAGDADQGRDELLDPDGHGGRDR